MIVAAYEPDGEDDGGECQWHQVVGREDFGEVVEEGRLACETVDEEEQFFIEGVNFATSFR